MWIMTNKGMLSIVEHRDSRHTLVVRARDDTTLPALFPDYEQTETKDADYRFRIETARGNVKALMLEQIDAIDYHNFKNSVPDDDLHDAYTEVWSAMMRYQTRKHGSSYRHPLWPDIALEESHDEEYVYEPDEIEGGLQINDDGQVKMQ